MTRRCSEGFLCRQNLNAKHCGWTEAEASGIHVCPHGKPWKPEEPPQAPTVEERITVLEDRINDIFERLTRSGSASRGSRPNG